MRLIKVLLILILMTIPFEAIASSCGDGRIDELLGEQCDPRATQVENMGCEEGEICAPHICQCVVDYGATNSIPSKTKTKKVKIKK